MHEFRQLNVNETPSSAAAAVEYLPDSGVIPAVEDEPESPDVEGQLRGIP